MIWIILNLRKTKEETDFGVSYSPIFDDNNQVDFSNLDQKSSNTVWK